MTDTDAVTRYAESRDAEAFAHLVGQYQAMVLATCRRRVTSPADVDDAVQETFLRLAKAADTVRSNVAAWLHRCATNVAIDTNRRAQTRKKHEAAAAAGRSVEIEDVQQELLALREHLDAALLKLDEPARELILQRYFAGRSQTEIAKAANVTPAAISQRLDRAVHALRIYLNTSAAPAIAIASTAGLGVLLSSESASAAVPASLTAKLNAIGLTGAPVAATAAITAGVSAGVIAAWAVAAVMLIGVTIGAIAFWPAHSRVATIPPMPPSAAAPAKSPGPAQSPPAPSAVTVRPNADAPAAPNWQVAPVSEAALSGHVTDADGKPIEGAQVTLEGGNGRQLVQTDAAGAYAFPTLSVSGQYHIGVSAKGFLTVEAYPVRGSAMVLNLSKSEHAQRNIVLERGVPVTVRVVDAAGENLEQVRVSAIPVGQSEIPQPATFDPQTGIATLTLPPSNAPVAVIAHAKGRPDVFKRITPKSPAEPIDLTLTLDVGMVVRGTVFGSDNKPAADWGVYAKPIDWPDPMTSNAPSKIDADGKFAIADVLPGKYMVWLQIDARASTIGVYDFKADEPVVIKLDRPTAASLVSLSGRVKWEGKFKGVGSLWVEASRVDGPNDFYSVQLTPKPDRQGEQSYTLKDLPPGEYRLNFNSTRIEPVTLERVTVPGPVPTVTLKATGQSSIAGQVTDAATGQPVTNFARRLRKLKSIGDGPNYVPDVDWVQVSNPEGKYAIDLPGPGEYQVQISAGNYAWTWSAPVRVEKPGNKATADVKLPAGGSLSGVVLDADGKPLAGAKVIPWSRAGSNRVEWAADTQAKRFGSDAGAVTTDAGGRYTLNHLPAGRETLKIVHPSFAPAIVSNLAITDSQSSAAPETRLNPGGIVEGTVYTIDGQPAPNVVLQFQDAGSYNGDEDAGRVAQVTTDEKGHYRVEHLATQTLWVNLNERWGHPGVNRRVVRPMDGVTTTLDFGGPIAVTGRYLRNGQPLPNTKLGFSTGERYFGMQMADVTTDANGRFTLHGLPKGRHVLFADIANDRLPLREIMVADQSIDLGDVQDDRGPVTVRLQAETPGDEVKVETLGIALDPATYGSMPMLAPFKQDKDHPGVWHSDDVPAGRYKLVGYGAPGGVKGTIDRQAGDKALDLTIPLPARADKPKPVQPDPAGRVPVVLNVWTKDGLLVTNAEVTVVAPAERQPWIGHELTRLLAPPGPLKIGITTNGNTIERTITVPQPADVYNGSTVDVVLP